MYGRKEWLHWSWSKGVFHLQFIGLIIACHLPDVAAWKGGCNLPSQHICMTWLYFPLFVIEESNVFTSSDIRIKEEPDSGEWQLSADSTLNTSDLSHLRVRLVDDEDPLGQEGRRLRRVACTCPNCKESGGRWVSTICLRLLNEPTEDFNFCVFFFVFFFISFFFPDSQRIRHW